MQAHPEEEDEHYDSAEDDDFNPEAEAVADEDESSDGEEKTTAGRGKRKTIGEAEDLDFNNSGDESTLRKAQRNKKRRGRDDDDGGEGGLVKTRAQRMVEGRERRPLVKAGKATVDVDDLWAKMSSTAPEPATLPFEATEARTRQSEELEAAKPTSITASVADILQQHHTPQTKPAAVTVTIKRTYEFAGKLEVEEREVPATSAEAKLYLAEQKAKEAAVESLGQPEQKAGLRKPMKRKSLFTGSGTGLINGSTPVQGPKLNTLQKSKLDWAQQVDKEGIADELDEHSRAKDSYSSRMDFLGRMDSKREEGARHPRPS